ncbi:MAG: hypothetical protein VKJ02_14800 [Snowella sp.]|nr:hypothetical protein [Snowella sp.]
MMKIPDGGSGQGIGAKLNGSRSRCFEPQYLKNLKCRSNVNALEDNS